MVTWHCSCGYRFESNRNVEKCPLCGEKKVQPEPDANELLDSV